MTGGAWAALIVAGALALGNWAAVARGSKPLEYACKPAVMVALIAVALGLDPVSETARVWFVAALVLSLAGDVFLMLPGDRLTAGLSSFLAAHVAYLVGLRLVGGSFVTLAAAALVMAVVAAVIGSRILIGVRRGAQPELSTPVAAYMVVIAAMVAAALATGRLLAGTGAVLFFASDALIATNRFVRPLRWAPVTIMVTYHLGQAGLVTSLGR